MGEEGAVPFDVFAVVFHDYVDEVVDRGWGVLGWGRVGTFGVGGVVKGDGDVPFSSRTSTSQLSIL